MDVQSNDENSEFIDILIINMSLNSLWRWPKEHKTLSRERKSYAIRSQRMVSSDVTLESYILSNPVVIN